MKFTEILKESLEVTNNISVIKPKQEVINESKTPEELLRSSGVKIRLVTPTSFGTQFDLAKVYDSEDIENILKGFNIKIKGKSVFVIS